MLNNIANGMSNANANSMTTNLWNQGSRMSPVNQTQPMQQNQMELGLQQLHSQFANQMQPNRNTAFIMNNNSPTAMNQSQPMNQVQGLLGNFGVNQVQNQMLNPVMQGSGKYGGQRSQKGSGGGGVLY